MLKVASSHSNDPDSLAAVSEVLAQCQITLAGQSPQAGLLLEQIHAVFPQLELIGGTTDGEMSSVLEFQQDSLTLIFFCSDEIKFRAAAKLHLALSLQLGVTAHESLTTSTVSILQGLEAA
jgi:hypothetical protein